MTARTYETERNVVDLSGVSFPGRVLDIGGGGEEVISRIAGDAVIAVDNRPEELAETPDIGVKIFMDGCDLRFLDGSFENITCFFTLMYMPPNDIRAFIAEAFRVLKPGGALWIWDAVIPPEKLADVFVAQVLVKLPNGTDLTVGYGAVWDKALSADLIRAIGEEVGFTVIFEETVLQTFTLRFHK